MTAGDLITADYQIEYNDVVAGDVTGLEVVDIELFSSPEVRFANIVRPLDHGSFQQEAFYDGRSIMVSLEVWGSDETTHQAALLEAMKLSTLASDDLPLVVKVPGFGKVQLNAKPVRRAVSPINLEYSIGHKTDVLIEYFASDPRILNNSETTTVLLTSTTAGGLTYDLSYDLSYGASGTGGSTVQNNGAFETRPVITIAGPVSGFNLENVTTGKKLAFDGTLLTGESLVVDFANRTVLLGGSASRYSWVQDTTQWWTLEPGSNDLRFNGSTTGSPTATVVFRDAWI